LWYYFAVRRRRNICQSKWIYCCCRGIAPESVHVEAPHFSQQIPIQPPLEVRIIEPIAVIVHPTGDVGFFGREPVDVRRREAAVAVGGLPEGIVAVFSDLGLAGVEHVSDVAVGVGVVTVVVGPGAAAALVGMAPGQESSDPAGALEAAG
jgi:hypothetical protein